MNKKKLLILGGTQISLQILWAAKEMGLLVYVADYNEDSPCKRYADKSFLISASDVDGITKLIKAENIDGVLMGYADVLMPFYNEICKKAGVPCYSNNTAISVTSNKDQFKEYCRKFNIPTVQEYSLDDVLHGKAQFPLIVKPVDNSGSRGIYICNDINDFEIKYEKALELSKSKHIIIERLMNSGEATIFYYLHNGEVYLLGVADRWMYQQKKDVLKLPVGYTFPSRNIENFIKYQNEDIISMFKSLKMEEGMAFIQSFVENGKYIIYEMGYRLTGSIEHHLMNAIYDFNHLKKIISFAIGDKVETQAVEKLDPMKGFMANVTLLLKEGIISRISGFEELSKLPYVVGYHISYQEGDKISDTEIGRLSQVGVRILLTADSRQNLLENMNIVKELVHIQNEKGEDMIIRDYNYNQLCVRG